MKAKTKNKKTRIRKESLKIIFNDYIVFPHLDKPYTMVSAHGRYTGKKKKRQDTKQDMKRDSIWGGLPGCIDMNLYMHVNCPTHG